MDVVTRGEMLQQLDILDSKCRQEMYDALDRQEQMFLRREQQLIDQIRGLQEQVRWLQLQQQTCICGEERLHKVRKIVHGDGAGTITHMCYRITCTLSQRRIYIEHNTILR